ncbi:molybdopterin-guanine dinucleotide biosynthesis protein B [Zhaonella formicivorans]|uniref:molybdopterin-guanine dinucleotide biosynthesis protein B n=1 Tax=Zhaonella formicivorans TaxID=2528593 RepID=UPI0010E0F0AC
MIPIVSVVGRSNSGKTTYLEKLLKEIKKRGYRVATIKHHCHDFEIDQPGKDTWRHAEAGADVTVISSPHKMALIEKVEKEKNLDEIAELIQNVDLIITEGYKKGNKPKIEILRKAVSDDLVCPPEELMAVVTDVDLNLDIPCFSLEDAVGLANFLEMKVLKPAKNI